VPHRTIGAPEFRIKDITTCTRSMTAKRQPITSTASYVIHLLVVLPSPSPNKVSTLKWRFRSSILGLWFPLSTLNSTPYDAKPMTRGLGGVLTLPSRGLASGAAAAPIFYRFISAHWVSFYRGDSVSSIFVFLSDHCAVVNAHFCGCSIKDELS
jgi:hypothetical protein